MIPGSGRFPVGGNGYPLQDSGLENFMDYVVHGVTWSQTQPSNFHFHDYMQINLGAGSQEYYVGIAVSFSAQTYQEANNGNWSHFG